MLKEVYSGKPNRNKIEAFQHLSDSAEEWKVEEFS